jgi:hypothetical protein
MSEMGQFQTSGRLQARSVRPSTTDMSRLHRQVRFVPVSDSPLGQLILSMSGSLQLFANKGCWGP